LSGLFMNTQKYTLGIDIGSTTVKAAILDTDNNISFSDYQRHYANIQETLAKIIASAKEQLGNISVSPMITGSGGLSISKHLEIPFVQEVVSVATSLKVFAPHTDVAIELGGEDAKIIYFTGGIDQRMNGICAGGTGSFIDQMASLLQTDAVGLNEYAKNHKAIYPIAARCGVFAKSDIQPLINEGATKEDLAASIFQAVVNQTISGLACGKPIRGNVAFLGGPLHFLSELKNAFIKTLKLTDNAIIAPPHSHLFAASGAAMNSNFDVNITLDELSQKLSNTIKMEHEIDRLEPLFNSDLEYNEFTEKHAKHTIKKGIISEYKGNCFLGIDAGSTTTKAALIGDDGTLLYSFYSSNNGNPLKTTVDAVREISELIPDTANIIYSCSTGYGEALIKAALLLDEGEVETVAHYYAAAFFEPKVDCILDIGGQDMKCIRIKNQTIENVQLNEACSAGCGSFIETFAKSLNFNVQDFATEALYAKHPIDLGTRCTVFMNSNVKQAQKEGAKLSDISAGLAYSVIKNALYKVIKVTKASELGKNIVVQGGTFYNDAVLRSFEKIADCNAVRPDIAGIMGAFGAALIARERFAHNGNQVSTSMLPINEILKLEYETSMKHCQLCTNNCMLTINKFNGDREFISGNRCERGLGKTQNKNTVPNLFDYKIKRTFSYTPLSTAEAKRGIVGIPRVLNMYENFPYWAVFFKELGYRTIISPASTKKIYELGIESIPSESECYPAKLVHGHVSWLLNRNLDLLFYPCIPYEYNEIPDASNHFNCPIVTSYAENIKNNVEELKESNIRFLSPFIAFTNEEILTKGLIDVFKAEGIPINEIKTAAHKAWLELMQFREDVHKKGEETLAYMDEHNIRGIVLAGRPYHADPEIHHGIPELITSYGIAVLTEDSISHLKEIERPTIVNDQWMYHSRLYAAATYVKTRDNLDLIQLNSFGCGLDAVTTDQVSDILSDSDKIYTVLKIDEVNNLGSARIRIRSLISALKVREIKKYKRSLRSSAHKRVEFTKEMRDNNYTILCPQLSPIHFDLIEPALRSCGYNVVVLQNDNKSAINTGLQYVNNDACYPSIIVIGQLMEALLSGEYDLNRTALFMSQTGGGCRASNYIAFVRRALEKAGMSQVPVISVNANGMETNEGFNFTMPMFVKAMQAIVYGDVFMRVLYRTRPYEVVPNSANKLHEKWRDICSAELMKPRTSMRNFNKILKGIIKDFDELLLLDIKKPRVGVVGEILVKFSPAANNHIVDLLEAEGAEAVMPDLMDFLLYCLYNMNFQADKLGKKRSTAHICNIMISVLEHFRRVSKREFEKSNRFIPPIHIKKLSKLVEPFVSLGNQTGEGWFLTAEMIELINTGAKNIVCTQPFGCLPNHIVGKGVIKELRHAYPEANIIAVDYDPGASEVNQLNRIKLMLATANKNMNT
jgi:Uncharacterized protein conserved in bacteria